MGGFRWREVLEGTLIWMGNLGIMMGILTVKILKFLGVLEKDGSHSLISGDHCFWIPSVDTPCKPLFTAILCKFHHGIIHIVEADSDVLQGLDFEGEEIENNLRNYEKEATEQFIDDADLSPEELERKLREEYQRDQEMRAELIRSKKGGKSEE